MGFLRPKPQAKSETEIAATEHRDRSLRKQQHDMKSRQSAGRRRRRGRSLLLAKDEKGIKETTLG